MKKYIYIQAYVAFCVSISVNRISNILLFYVNRKLPVMPNTQLLVMYVNSYNILFSRRY